jgi:hypothetical protein
MRHLIVVSCTLLIFVLSFSTIYIFFRASAPHIRGLMGGGFFLLAALLLLGKDFASVTFTKRIL